MENKNLPEEMQHYCISEFCKIKGNVIHSSLDQFHKKIILENDFADFSKVLYQQLNVDYPKFFKMDNLCKLAFLTSEILLKNASLHEYNEEKIGVVISNAASTLDTDNNYFNTIIDKNNYFPSPALFVYTLPNILNGEICIRNKIKGENAFFVFDEFNPNFICDYVMSLFKTEKIDCCITGWVDYTKDNFESILFLVEKNTIEISKKQFNKENTKEIYLA